MRCRGFFLRPNRPTSMYAAGPGENDALSRPDSPAETCRVLPLRQRRSESCIRNHPRFARQRPLTRSKSARLHQTQTGSQRANLFSSACASPSVDKHCTGFAWPLRPWQTAASSLILHECTRVAKARAGCCNANRPATLVQQVQPPQACSRTWTVGQCTHCKLFATGTGFLMVATAAPLTDASMAFLERYLNNPRSEE